eukprot:1958132-Alexandrium_andersonii.AAC.1
MTPGNTLYHPSPRDALDMRDGILLCHLVPVVHARYQYMQQACRTRIMRSWPTPDGLWRWVAGASQVLRGDLTGWPAKVREKMKEEEEAQEEEEE